MNIALLEVIQSRYLLSPLLILTALQIFISNDTISWQRSYLQMYSEILKTLKNKATPKQNMEKNFSVKKMNNYYYYYY
jgi:hypothetical protein